MKQEPLIISDTKKAAKAFRLIADNLTIKSIACIPLAMGSKVLGLIYVDNRLTIGTFSNKDFAIMTAIATQISLYLMNLSLISKLQNLKDSYHGDTFFVKQIKSHKDFPQIIGKSKAITEVLNSARKVAKTNATVLILGETGVGKELVARSIHQLSDRADRPFIVVNVSALSQICCPPSCSVMKKVPLLVLKDRKLDDLKWQIEVRSSWMR